RNVNYSPCLFADCLHDAWMRMTQRIYPETCYKIQIALAIQIVEKNAFSALENQRIPTEGLKQELTLACDDLICVRHGGKIDSTEPGSVEPNLPWFELQKMVRRA